MNTNNLTYEQIIYIINEYIGCTDMASYTRYIIRTIKNAPSEERSRLNLLEFKQWKAGKVKRPDYTSGWIAAKELSRRNKEEMLVKLFLRLKWFTDKNDFFQTDKVFYEISNDFFGAGFNNTIAEYLYPGFLALAESTRCTIGDTSPAEKSDTMEAHEVLAVFTELFGDDPHWGQDCMEFILQEDKKDRGQLLELCLRKEMEREEQNSLSIYCGKSAGRNRSAVRFLRGCGVKTPYGATENEMHRIIAGLLLLAEKNKKRAGIIFSLLPLVGGAPCRQPAEKETAVGQAVEEASDVYGK